MFAGPWVGEFGWQLFQWQGFLRFLAMQEKHDNFVVCCPTGNDYLYEDFATEILNYDPPSRETNMWMCHEWSYDYDPFKCYDLILKPEDCRNYKQAFITFGEKGNHLYDIVIHARNTGKCGTAYRNWDRKKWKHFVRKFPNTKIATIGTEEGALGINGTADKRGIPLNELADVLANSTVLVGPSSGPIHFGSLCGIPHVTWSPANAVGVMSNKERYEKAWNPKGTKVTFLESGWNPEVKEIAGAVRKYL